MTDRDLKLNDLLARISQGDPDAMADFHHATRGPLSAYIRKLVRDPADAEEVMQDLYRYVWLSAANYSHGRGVPFTWLYLIARSRALDSLRRARRSAFLEPLLDSTLQTDGESQQVVRFEVGLVRQAVSQLPEQQRFLVDLAFIDGYSHSEIADRTGLPLGTVKGRIRSALITMRQMLDPIPDATRNRAA
ncbi:MAG: sigma-70 family RNA polymerase sigma factor [Acidobacteria bacterium]|nr:sigma-70 family RNA polymerase sigma factor [Acidobacteriota bacterium]